MNKISAFTTKPVVKPIAKSFVELCARSNFSFLQGASHPEEMVEEAIRLDYDGICIADLNGLYGVVRAYQTATSPSIFSASLQPRKDFKCLFGVELTLTDGSSVTLVPLKKTGYVNLCRLLTLGKRGVQKGFSRISASDVIQHHQELLIFCEPKHYQEFRETFAGRIYIPIWRDLTWESLKHCEEAFALERHQQAQLFVTQKPFMHQAERKVVFDVLTCILHHTTLAKAKNILRQNGERYLHNLRMLSRLWQDRLDLLEVTIEIAQRVEFSLQDIRYRYPDSSLPPGKTVKEHLRDLTEKGLLWRYPQGMPMQVRKIVDHELQVISELEYEDYFLTLYEICEFARRQGILYQGRGSAANSVVCFSLGLTSVDPTEVDLLFERFLSKRRAEPPDIDIDFEHERREEVIQHIYAKYSEHHAAMVCTVIRYKSRMAFRESAKVFGVPLITVNAMVKFMGRDGLRRLVEDPLLYQKYKIDEHTWKLLLAIAQALHGFPRHLGIHSGGFLITQDPITEIVPVEKASMHGRFVIQWNKDDVNFLKLMKIDILSLGMLTALRKSFALLREHKKIDWNLAQVPKADPPTYQMICKADTVGVFQIESRAQMQTLPRLKPKNFYDLVVEVALVRPGPLQGGMVHPYLRRRQGLEKVVYPHPNLEPVLKKTMGVPIFQEQVIRIAMVAANFSGDEADELRRVMSMAWKKKGTMDGVRDRLFRGFKENGISDAYCQQIYKTIEGFANYGFPESHAASFALLTYASSYLHCHHPDVFACALLNSQPMGFYSPRVLIADAQRHGVTILPLDIQKSNYDYSLEVGNLDEQRLALRVGLRSVYGINSTALIFIEKNRNQQGEFKDLTDFVKRTSLSRSVLMKLAAAGAFQCFDIKETRNILWQIESISLDPQSFLWGQPQESFSEAEENSVVALNPLPFESNWEAMNREYAYKGFSIHLHPLSILRSSLLEKNEFFLRQKQIPYIHSEQFENLRNGALVRVAGLATTIQRPPTAKGMCFITLEDEFGFINVVIPPDIYQKDRMTIYTSSLFEIRGTLERRDSVINIKAQRVFPLLQGSIESVKSNRYLY